MQHSPFMEEVFPIIFLLNAAFQGPGVYKAVAWMMAVRWSGGSGEAQVIPMFILAQISTRQHFESSQLFP